MKRKRQKESRIKRENKLKREKAKVAFYASTINPQASSIIMHERKGRRILYCWLLPKWPLNQDKKKEKKKRKRREREEKGKRKEREREEKGKRKGERKREQRKWRRKKRK